MLRRQGTVILLFRSFILVFELCAVLVVVLGLLLSTSAELPMVWDEGNAIWRAEGIGAWISKFQATPFFRWWELLCPQQISRYWKYTTVYEGHPSFYGLVIAVGRYLAPADWPAWQQARVGPIFLAALAAAAVYWRLKHLRNRGTALAAVAGILLIPRLFAHLHFAIPDSPLCSLWLLTWASFPVAGASARTTGNLSGLEGFRAAPAIRAVILRFTVFGLLLGLTLSTKFTGWLAVAPFLIWILCYRRWWDLVGLGFASLLALGIFVLVNPAIWHQPLTGIVEFWRRNLDRAAYNVSILFLGQRYDLYHPLPWYNTAVWILVALPTFILFCAAIGAFVQLRNSRHEPWGLLVVFHAACLLIVRATPWAPPHDGLRLFLPSVAFAGILAGIGLNTLWQQVIRVWKERSYRYFGVPARAVGLASFCLVFIGSASCLWNLWCYRPHWLSFYNILIGGPRGAVAKGMEVTYYWDSLTAEVLGWLSAHTKEGEKVFFAAGPYENLLLLRQWGRVAFEFRPEAPGQFRWYVLQYRFGVWQPEDWWLAQNKSPVYVKWLFGSRDCWCGADVVLLAIYRWEDLLEARSAVRDTP
jgi:hypothetical protein